jgi:hypothetical protein
LPYYSCGVLLEPFTKLNVEYSFYHINERLELDEDIQLGEGEAILYVNYYGLKQAYVESLTDKYGCQLIVDNTQAFYAQPVKGIDTFYSCRKFFGVPDGAYLYCDQPVDMALEEDQSWDRMTHLLKRIDVSPEAAYQDFSMHDDLLKENPIRKMSRLTHRIMASIDHDEVESRRIANYRHLNAALSGKNGISLQLTDDAVPMVYPFLTEDENLRQRLIDNKIFVARYWPNVLEWCDAGSIEHQLTKFLLPLPIDQRYGSQDMQRIIELI